MNIIYQDLFSVQVRRAGDEIVSMAVKGTLQGERSVSLRVGVDDFLIREAVLENYRPGVEATSTPLPGLTGVRSYLDAGPDLRRGMEGLDPDGRSLVQEAVKGVVQAETFLWQERGFSSPREYDRFWTKMYVDSCRYYSNLDRVTCTWDEHVGHSDRGNLMFTRFKSQEILRHSPGTLWVLGVFLDSFHGINVTLEIEEKTGLVLSARAEFNRSPDDVCREAAAFMPALVGQPLIGWKKKDLALLLGGGEGCVHIIDMIYDSVHSLEEAFKEV